MDLDKETETQIKELQMLEQNLQSILMQKQAFQLELSETESALGELGKSGEEIYRITGNIMVKSSKSVLEKDLTQKKELISLGLKSLDSQEKNISDSAETLRKKVLSKIKN